MGQSRRRAHRTGGGVGRGIYRGCSVAVSPRMRLRPAMLKSKAALKIVQVGDPVLRLKACELTVPKITSTEIQNLIARMRETLHKAPGVGLAAPQVGFPLQVAIIEDREEYQDDVDEDTLSERERGVVPFHVIINPV